jgi:putative N6-adenine-specific DNA methylase
MIAKTFFGLEGVLKAELEKLGAKNIEVQNRAVEYEGDLALLYRSNLQLRTALRILVPIKTDQVLNERQLYTTIKKIDWTQYLDVRGSLRVDSIVNSELFTHSQYVALLTKDAIVDQFREASGRRPRIELNHPDLVITVHINKDRLTLSLDSSCDSLHMRGYRQDTNDAPLNEVMAAGLVLLSGWDGKSSFVDPMCGSGTILIEAARYAFNISPMKSRTYFGFKNWKDFDYKIFEEVLKDIKSQEKVQDIQIVGSEISLKTAQIAKQNIRFAGFAEGVITIQSRAFQKMVPPPAPGVLISNPPYDERLKEADIEWLYEQIGEKMFEEFQGYSTWLISSNREALKYISLKTSKKLNLMNGPLEAFFFGYEINKRDEVQTVE